LRRSSCSARRSCVSASSASPPIAAFQAPFVSNAELRAFLGSEAVARVGTSAAALTLPEHPADNRAAGADE
jgi:hypothetical protein